MYPDTDLQGGYFMLDLRTGAGYHAFLLTDCYLQFQECVSSVYANTIHLSHSMNRLLSPIYSTLVLVMLLCPASKVHAQGASLSEVVSGMTALVDTGLYEQAWQLGESHLFDYEGEPEFDFILGLAAIESGRPNEAVFAFERLLLSNFRRQRVQLELGRAYFLSNNLAAAETVFREVLAGNPPDNVARNIEGFLTLIAQAQAQTRSSFRWYLGAMLGTDNNINSATDLGVIDTPIGEVTLSPAGQSIRSNFMEQSAGFVYTRPRDRDSRLIVQGNVNRRDNFSSDQFDLDIFSSEVSYSHDEGRARFNHTLRLQKVNLDSSAFQKSGSILTGVQLIGDNGWGQNFTAAYTAVRYNTADNPGNNLRDINQTLLAAGVSKSHTRWRHSFNLFHGRDDIQRQAGKNNATIFTGIALTEQVMLNQSNLAYLRLSRQMRKHRADEPIFGVRRENRTYNAALGWIWQVNSALTITSEVNWTDNASNIGLYSYDRLRLQSAVRYQF